MPVDGCPDFPKDIFEDVPIPRRERIPFRTQFAPYLFKGFFDRFFLLHQKKPSSQIIIFCFVHMFYFVGIIPVLVNIVFLYT